MKLGKNQVMDRDQSSNGNGRRSGCRSRCRNLETRLKKKNSVNCRWIGRQSNQIDSTLVWKQKWQHGRRLALGIDRQRAGLSNRSLTLFLLAEGLSMLISRSLWWVIDIADRYPSQSELSTAMTSARSMNLINEEEPMRRETHKEKKNPKKSFFFWFLFLENDQKSFSTRQ